MSFKTKSAANNHCAKICYTLGPGWEGRVWENLGWHVAWQNGSVTLYYSVRGDYYHVLIGEPGGCGGHMDLTFDGNSNSDPKKAIMAACECAQTVFEKQWKPIQLSVANVVLNLGVER